MFDVHDSVFMRYIPKVSTASCTHLFTLHACHLEPQMKLMTMLEKVKLLQVSTA